MTTALPIKRLHIKLARVAKNLKKWKRGKIGNTRLQLAIAKEIILQLELAQESRTLTAHELDLRRRLKIRSTGLAVIEKSRMQQRSRLTYIRCGDANTKLFHLKANARRRKTTSNAYSPRMAWSSLSIRKKRWPTITLVSTWALQQLEP